MKLKVYIITLLFCSGFVSCNNPVTQDKEDYKSLYNAYFDVHGPAKEIAYSFSGSAENIYYTLKSIKLTKQCEFKSATCSNNIKIFSDKEDTVKQKKRLTLSFQELENPDIDGEFTFLVTPETNNRFAVALSYAPEYNENTLFFNYDASGKLSNAKFTNYTWNENLGEMVENNFPIALKDEGIDSIGNWTKRTLSDGNNELVISRAITYYSVDELSKDSLTKESSDESFENSTTGSDFGNVQTWKISLSYMESSEREISAMEAAAINQDIKKNPEKYDNDENIINYWVDQDSNTGQWIEHTNRMKVTKQAIITDTQIVNQLNRLMDDPEYEEYKEDVRISGTTATAVWNSGNRSGGMNLPESLAEYLNSVCK